MSKKPPLQNPWFKKWEHVTGALTEQYVCQQLKNIEDLDIYYYTNDRGSCEVDFVVDTGEKIVPVEVKAEVNLKAKSLKTYREKFLPEISVRTSMADFKKEEWLVNLPLYAVDQIVTVTDRWSLWVGTAMFCTAEILKKEDLTDIVRAFYNTQ